MTEQTNNQARPRDAYQEEKPNKMEETLRETSTWDFPQDGTIRGVVYFLK